MALPVVAHYLLFHYVPMYGAIIAFKEFSPAAGIWRSPWVGLEHFKAFFESYYFWRVLRNTIAISLSSLLFSFPAPITLALLLNEVQSTRFKRVTQTISYMPHFVSLIVICGIIVDFSAERGLFNDVIGLLGGERGNLLVRPELFRPIYIASGIWQEVGWGAIIYLAALSGIDPQLYEAATLDGAGKWKQMLYVTLPGLVPTIVILLILRIGQLMNVGFEKIILLYNANTYETADVISTFVYRRGLLEFSFSFSTAVGLFNSVVNFLLLLGANRLSRRFSETSLW